MVPLSPLISRDTDLPRVKLAEGNVPEVIVPEVKQVSSKSIFPLRPKLPQGWR